MRRMGVVAVLVLGGCFAPGTRITDDMPDDLPAGACEDTDADACETSGSTSGGESGESSSTTTAAQTDDCNASDGCLGQDACVAEWDPEAEQRGPFTCRFACVPLLDESAWCSDDASCCDADALCTARGYCVLAEEESG